MQIGNRKHELILKNTIINLENQGYKVINLNGKSPTAIAINDSESIAITVNVGTKKTITFLEDHYNMFDRIVRIDTNDVNDSIDKLKKQFNSYSLVILGNKSPDAIAYKNKAIFAVEVLGLNKGCKGAKMIRDKESIYDMFDGLMIKTFNYDDDSDFVFTETFGRSMNKKL